MNCNLKYNEKGNVEMKPVLVVWLSPREVAQMLAVSENTLRKWRQTGQGPKAVKVNRQVVRYTKHDVDRWIALMESKADEACTL